MSAPDQIDAPSRLLRLAARLHLWKPARFVQEARTALAEGDRERARELLAEAARRAPAWAEPLYLAARCARMEGGDRDEEQALLLAALDRQPGHREAERALLAIRAWRFEPATRAWHLFHGGRAAAALEAFHAALDMVGTRLPEPSRAGLIAGIGWCQHALGRADLGASAFAEALEVDAQLAHAHKGLGICLFQLGRYAEAEAALSCALALEPRLHDALAFMGWCAYSTGRFAEALELFERALAENPLLGDAAWGAAWSHWKLDDVERATAGFRRAVELERAHPSQTDVAQWVLGDARYAELAREWPSLVEPPAVTAPAAPVEEFNALRRPLIEALGELRAGDARACLRVLQDAPVKSARDRWRARLLEGRARLALEEPERALVAFRAALEILPGAGEAAVEAARLLEDSGRRREAVALLRASLRSSPTDPDLLEELERLEHAARGSA